MNNICVGDQVPPFIVESVPVEPMKTMALILNDPNPIHWDAAKVRELGLGDRVINQGPINQGYIFNALINWLGDPGLIRSMTIRFLGNVYGGDRVEAGGEVTAVDSIDGVDAIGGEATATCAVWLHGPNGPVITGTAILKLP